jgi:hypothetical protein
MSSNSGISLKIKDPSGKENEHQNIQLIHLIFEKGDNKVITFTEAGTNPISGNYTQIQIRFKDGKNFIYASDGPPSESTSVLAGKPPIAQGKLSSFSISQAEPNTQKKISISTTEEGSAWSDIYVGNDGSKTEVTIITKQDDGKDTGKEDGKDTGKEDGKGELDHLGIKKIYPDAPSKKFLTNFELEKKIRNYRSKKPSEPSIEYTIDTGTPIINQEATYYVKINGFKPESDTISNKSRGGHHSSSKAEEGTCYDFEVNTDGSAEKTLEVERPHPSMHENHQKPNFVIGESLVGKWIGVKAILWNLPNDKGVHLEMRLDYPVPDIEHPPNNWKVYWQVDDTGQLKEGMITKPFGSLFTCRIDGVWKGQVSNKPKDDDVSPPDFKYASFREIQPPT